MGRFVGNGEERTVVNKYIDSYMNGTNEYGKYLQSAPNFVTYYSRDQEASTEGSGLGEVEEVVGERSGIRYNRVNNVPFYMVEDSAPELMADGIVGLNYMVESTAVIIPDTVVPVPNDLFVFSYWEQTRDKTVVFRITNVSTTAVDSNTYYQVSFQSTPYDYNELESKQLVDRYEVIYDHIGSSKPAVLMEKDYILAERLEKTFDKVASIYIEDYYDDRLNVFTYKGWAESVAAEVTYFDRSLHKFLKEQNFFINSKTLAINILLQDLKVTRALEAYSPYTQVGQPTITSHYTLSPSSLKIFKLYPLNVKEITYLPTGDDLPLDNEVLSLYEEFFGSDSNLDSQVIESKLEDWLLKVDNLVTTSFPSLENYLSFPILLYILNYLGEYLVRGVRKHA